MRKRARQANTVRRVPTLPGQRAGWRRWTSLVFLACGARDTTQVIAPCSESGDSTSCSAIVDAGRTAAVVADAGAQPADAETSLARCEAGAACDVPDAYLAAHDACELGPLSSACGGSGCPALEEAVEWLRQRPTDFVLQTPCEDEDGRALISFATSTGTFSSVLIYDAATAELVARQTVSDVTEYCDQRTEVGYYGSFFPACELDRSKVPPLPEVCQELLPWNYAPDGGVPDACVFVINGADAGR
jgi:hypothetical protein